MHRAGRPMISERAGEAGAQAGPAPAPRLAIVTLDGSLLGAASAGQASGERCGGAAPVRHRSRQQCVQPAASSDRNSRRWRARGQAGELLLDKGACESGRLLCMRNGLRLSVGPSHVSSAQTPASCAHILLLCLLARPALLPRLQPRRRSSVRCARTTSGTAQPRALAPL